MRLLGKVRRKFKSKYGYRANDWVMVAADGRVGLVIEDSGFYGTTDVRFDDGHVEIFLAERLLFVG